MQLQKGNCCQAWGQVQQHQWSSGIVLGWDSVAMSVREVSCPTIPPTTTTTMKTVSESVSKNLVKTSECAGDQIDFCKKVFSSTSSQQWLSTSSPIGWSAKRNALFRALGRFFVPEMSHNDCRIVGGVLKKMWGKLQDFSRIVIIIIGQVLRSNGLNHTSYLSFFLHGHNFLLNFSPRKSA